MNFIRATFRIFFFAIGSIYYISRYLVKTIFVGQDFDRALRIRKQWFRQICWGLGVKIETFGVLPAESGLLVCNHRSYFDPIVILSQILAVPVGKAEIKTWPIIGYGAKVSGSIFVERKSKEGRNRARNDIRKMLRNGYCIMNYPEGKTHDNAQTTRFKPGMFRDAASEGFRIYPIALEYQRKDDAWVGTESFIGHFFRSFGKKHTYIKVKYAPALESTDATYLIETSKKWIDEELLKLRANWHSSTLTA